MMKAVLLKDFGEADQLYIGDIPRPEAGAGELLIKVAALVVSTLTQSTFGNTLHIAWVKDAL